MIFTDEANKDANEANKDADEDDDEDDEDVPHENPDPDVANPPDNLDNTASVDPGDDPDDGAVDGPPVSSYVDLARRVGMYRALLHPSNSLFS
jgi:hypothetical protein